MKILRVSTVPLSMNLFCRGLFRELTEAGHEIVAVSSPGKDLDDIQEREKVRIHAVPMERRISPVKDLGSLFRIISVIRKEKPDIIHSITPKAGLLTMLAAWICGVPNRIHTFTGLVFPTSKGLKRRLLMITDWLTCHFATNVHAEGKGVKNDLQKYGITKKNIEVLLNGSLPGIDTDFFNPALPEVINNARELEDKSRFTFIFIGRVGADKGVNELIESFLNINRKNPSSRLILLGWMENELDRLQPSVLTEIKTNDAIEYVGVKQDVRPWLLASDCLILPSYREGFPNAVLEAGAMGKPCIVTDINGSNEIVVDGETGIIVPVKNVEKLTEALTKIMEDSLMSEKMGQNARKRIKNLYERKLVRKALKDYYNSLKAKSKPIG